MTQPDRAVMLTGYDGQSFEALVRNVEITATSPRPGEAVFTSLGEYAIFKPAPGEAWSLAPKELPQSTPGYHWANAEQLRTRTALGSFLPTHMDFVDASQFREMRVTTPDNKVNVDDEGTLGALLSEHNISASALPPGYNLLEFIKTSEGTVQENASLHVAAGRLLLASAQSMVNVYHQRGGRTYKLKETTVTRFDRDGKQISHSKSNTRSSLGEKGHLIGGIPERPYDTARRGLKEEINVDAADILRFVSLGSCLRRKEARPKGPGHHIYSSLAAEDHTHYFAAHLNPRKVSNVYQNIETHPDGTHTKITLEWFEQTPKHRA